MARPEPASAAAPASGSVADAAIREQALDAHGSFIVQAPAGSGKTELLIQRLLVLLAQVERPEQVLAITFTRKAAAEMRARLLDALAAAADDAAPTPADAHKAALHARARAVVARDRDQGWALLESPARLRIQTIDSLCAALTRERPLRSGLGEAGGIADDASELYRTAARATLDTLEGGGAQADAVERLLLHLDDNHARAESLLCTLLARRDQWLRHLERSDDPVALRRGLEAELRAAVEDALRGLRAALLDAAKQLGIALEAELVAAAHPAARHVADAAPDAPIARLAALTGLPATEAEALPLWQGVADLLTTASGNAWRRTLNKNQGFPTDKAAGDPAALKAAKARAQALLDALSADPGLGEKLAAVRVLPPPAYDDTQWALLEALLALLPAAVHALRGAFAEAGETDYAEVALGAVRALEAPASEGDGAAPARDEARHLLVDEFQDTSHAQFRLLQALTAQWPTDGSHTLFLVGDPMQSIYRFREAEVGLFLRAQRSGIGRLPLQALTLGTNFRSDAGLVDWVNTVFPAVLAPAQDIAAGAVPFAPAAAFRPARGATAVHVHALAQPPERDRDALDAEEARRVAELVAALRRDRPDETVAVLARTRTHLRAIVPALQAAALPFQAVEIDALGERPEVLDLLTLLRALTHLGDRVAWLAVLRAPWCGLELADLLHLAGPAPRDTLWSRLNDPAVAAELSAAGRARAARFVSALAPALEARERVPLRRWVEGAWLALGGPACVAPGALPNVDACLARLEALPGGREPGDPAAFEQLLERLFAAPDPGADARLQVMSIHKAKGLEFDTVILPGLGHVPRSDDPPLLRWVERPVPAPGGVGLLLAPIHESGPARDPVYDYLAALEREKAAHETGRLLYVAATRARRELHLFGHAKLKDGVAQAPSSRSLLARLWPALSEAFDAAAHDDPLPTASGAGSDEPAQPATLRRLVADWRAPPAPEGLPTPAVETRTDGTPDADAYDIEFRWAGETARHVGTVVHRLLRLIARHGPERWSAGQGAFARPAVAAALGALGVPEAEREDAAARVLEALQRTLADPRGRWVLAEQREARSEYALTGALDGRPQRFVIDRTFVDDAGVRWIVDFKTGTHEGGDLDAFLAREQQRYRAQLEGYAALLARLEPGRPIRLALYFPLLQAWREWPAPALPSPGA